MRKSTDKKKNPETGFYAVYFREDYGTMPNEKANSEEKKSRKTNCN